MLNHKILVVGSYPFAKNTYSFLRSFTNDISYFQAAYRSRMLKPIDFIRFLKMVTKVDYIYTIGYFTPQSILFLIARLFKKKLIVHWIGSEVLSLKNSHYWEIHASYSITNKMQLELSYSGILSEVLPLYFEIKTDNMKNQFSKSSSHIILFYLVENQEDFYGIEYLRLLSNSFPSTLFYVIGSSAMKWNSDNIKFLGMLSENELNAVFEETTIYVRITYHDGLSQLLLDALSRGRIVISNTLYENVLYYNPLLHNYEHLIKLVGECLKVKFVPNLKSIKHIRDNYDYKIQVARYKELFKQNGILL